MSPVVAAAPAARAAAAARPAGVALRAEGLGQDARGAPILDGVTFAAARGELIAVLGPSGAGKSTLIELLAGAARPARGRVSLLGRPLEALRDRLGYVPQVDLVHGALTLREALEVTAALRAPALAASPVELEARVARLAVDLGLADRLDVRAARLSGGERRRASLAVELLADPDVLVVDEVTSGLDARAEARVVDALRAVADAGTSVVAITHTLGQLGRFDRVLILAGGRLVFDGAPAAALAHFGVTRPEALYARLAERPAGEWAALAPRPPAAGPEAAPRPAPGRPGALRQLGPVVGRQLRLAARDGLSLALLLAQAPVIAWLVAFAYDAGTRAGRAEVGFKLALAAIWLGCVGSCQELVKDRAIDRHERRAGLSFGASLASKVVLLLLLALAQAGALAGVACALEPLGAPPLRLAAALLGAAAAGGALGLVVSALVRTRTAAVGLTPLCLVPQVLLVGTLEPLRGVAAAVGRLMPAHWANEAVQRLLRGEAALQAGLALLVFVGLFLAAAAGVALLRDARGETR